MQNYIYKRYQDHEITAQNLDDGQTWFRLAEIVQALGSTDIDRHWRLIVHLGLDHQTFDVPSPKGTFKVVTRPAVLALLECEGTQASRRFADWLNDELPPPAPLSDDERLMKQARNLYDAKRDPDDAGKSWETLADELQVPQEHMESAIAQAKVLFSLGQK